jgi:hypothetical protein
MEIKGDEFPLNLASTILYGQSLPKWDTLTPSERKQRAKEALEYACSVLWARKQRSGEFDIIEGNL